VLRRIFACKRDEIIEDVNEDIIKYVLGKEDGGVEWVHLAQDMD
jgi:hypothetical protein